MQKATVMLHVTIALALSIHGTPSSEPVYETQFIFPAESLHNHSPSIVETRDGDLLACWFHGRGEKGDDTLVIRGARKRRGDSEWSKPFIMADNQNLPDPCRNRSGHPEGPYPYPSKIITKT